MNSFLADTGRPEVDRRLWLQTTNKIEAKAEKTYKGQDKHVTIFNLNNFRDAQIDYPSSFADLYQAKVKDKPEPDPHQVEAIADVTAGLKTSDRGQMIMACGTGKTFTTLWIKEALRLAAEQGVADAQTNLGYMYDNGLGFLQDNTMAHMWYNIGAANGSELSGTNRDEIAKEMTSEGIEKAQAMARECMSSDYKQCGY